MQSYSDKLLDSTPWKMSRTGRRFPRHYYTCPIPKPGDGSRLGEVNRHALLGNGPRPRVDSCHVRHRDLGRTAGDSPAFLITAPAGRGKGKTRFAQNFARVFGGHLDISPQEDIGVIKQRLLSPEAAGKRIATLDNLKTTRFSWGDYENLVTASIISGKRLYVGEGSRPNLITWTITLNGASLSTDMAQRVIEIRLREPDFDAGWEERVRDFIDGNRERIIADCIAFLQRPAKPMKRHSRWATWEAGVLSKVDHPDDCLIAHSGPPRRRGRGGGGIRHHRRFFPWQVGRGWIRPRSRRRVHSQ